jgi:DNA-binding protein HU-beta
MNKADIISELSKRTNITKKNIELIIENLVDILINNLKSGINITIAGFGSFISKTRHARAGVNPRNPKERIQIPEVRIAKFKTGKRLKDALKNK